MDSRVVVVTGGGGGMGLACARRFAAQGRTLVLNDVSAERLGEAERELRAAGADVRCIEGDLSRLEVVTRIAESASVAGPFGALVHSAGLSPTMAPGRRILEVNLLATERLLDAFLPLASEGSVAVCIASQSAHFVQPSISGEVATLLDEPPGEDFPERLERAGLELNPGMGYSISKLGVLRAVVRLAPRWGERGARIVSLSPGIIETPMGEQEFAAQPFMKTIVEKTPLRRKGSADEIASAVEFLCSEEASFITGSDILVDGGSTSAVVNLIT